MWERARTEVEAVATAPIPEGKVELEGKVFKADDEALKAFKTNGFFNIKNLHADDIL